MFSELSERGQAQANMHLLLLDMANATLNWINDEIQKQRVRDMIEALEPEVAQTQRGRPDCGVLLTPVFRS